MAEVKEQILEFIRNNDGCTFQKLDENFSDFFDNSLSTGQAICIEDGSNPEVKGILWSKVKQEYAEAIIGLIKEGKIRYEFCNITEYDDKKHIPEFQPVKSLEDEVPVSGIFWIPVKLYTV